MASAKRAGDIGRASEDMARFGLVVGRLRVWVGDWVGLPPGGVGRGLVLWLLACFALGLVIFGRVECFGPCWGAVEVL